MLLRRTSLFLETFSRFIVFFFKVVVVVFFFTKVEDSVFLLLINIFFYRTTKFVESSRDTFLVRFPTKTGGHVQKKHGNINNYQDRLSSIY